MKRPKPTKQLVIDVTGGNHGLIEEVHHGLAETPLNDFYQWLNFDEAIAFAAETWKRRHLSGNFGELAKKSDLYMLFSDVYRDAMPRLNANKFISEKLRKKHNDMNPFGRNLQERLEQVDDEAVEKLRESLQESTTEWVWHGQYQGRKAWRGGDNYKLRVMEFMPTAYPRKGRIVPGYASEIARLVSDYPMDYELPPEKPRPIQGTLF